MPPPRFVPMEEINWLIENEDQWNPVSGIVPPAPSAATTFTESESFNTSNEESLKESPDPYRDGFTQHCFKRYKFNERHPNAFLKLKPSRFGPAPPRRRIFIVPPMQREFIPTARPLVPESLGPKQEKLPVKEQPTEVTKVPTEEESEDEEVTAWIEERKKLQNLLDTFGDAESWLMRKKSSSVQEAKLLRKIRESRKMKTQLETELVASSSTEQLLPVVKKPKRITPLIKAPYPESLIVLQNLLHKQKLKLVDIFNKEDRSKTMKFKRADFIRIIEKTKVPISKNELEDVVIYLTSAKRGDYITHRDLVECQQVWLDHVKEQRKHAKEAKPEELPPTDQKVGPMTQRSCSLCQNKSKLVVPQKPKSNYLEVPPINTEVDRMHLTYTDMEEVGKRYRDVRRQLKRKIPPLELAGNCRMVKSGDSVVDSHCMPSTVPGDMGETVDRYRLACHQAWFQCVKLCEQYGVPLTEKLLKRALLYPGDKLLNYDSHREKLRQPGGYYDSRGRQGSVSDSISELLEEPESPIREKERDQESEFKKQNRKGKPIQGRWKSYAEFRNLTKEHSKRLQLAAQNLWDSEASDTSSIMSQMTFENEFMEREMKKMYSFLNPKTDANSFWPGHLLDKLRLYLPQMRRERGEALFSHVSPTRPAYPATYHPHRSYPVSGMKSVTYGDQDSRKHYYYI